MLGMFLYNWIGDLFKSSRMVFAVVKGININYVSVGNISRKLITLILRIAKLSMECSRSPCLP